MRLINQTSSGLRRLFTIVACSIGLASGVAHAGKPAALALDVSGPTTPQVEPFSELETKSPIELDAGTTIEFLHYHFCEAVTVKGGRLNFTKQRFLFKGGKILSKKRAECPKKVSLGGASQIGGVVLRGGEKKSKSLRLTTRPSFVLVGADADGYAAIRISQNGNSVLEAKLHGRVFFYPDSAPTLNKGQSYEVTLTPKGEGKQRTFKLKAQGRPKKYALTLIRVD
jgi:hypothetical protein